MCKSKWIVAFVLMIGCFCHWRGLSQGTTYTIKNPYTTDGNWYIGQLHFHTNNSDGSGTPAEMEAAYYDAGYDFVVTTDHRGTDPNYPGVGDGLTADPDNSGSGKDLLWILGEELSDDTCHLSGISVNARNTEILNNPPTWQTAIDEERTNAGIVQVNHPRWSGSYAVNWWAELNDFKRVSLIEAKNYYGSDDFLDSIPSNPVDLANEFRQVWWTANDDAHNKTTAVDGWCVVVQTASATIAEADIVSSLDSGNFYIRQGPCATGVSVSSVSVASNTITITLADIANTYTVAWYKNGHQLAETDSSVDTTASYTATGTEGYVWAKATNDSTGKVAITQPMYIGNSTDLSSTVAVSGGTGGDNIIDNNVGTYWDAGAGTGNFTIDSGSSKLLNAIKIQWSSSVNVTDRWNYKIETSPDDITYTEQVRTTYSNRASTTTDFFDVDARYVKVTVTSQSVGAGSNVRVLEAELFNSSVSNINYYFNNSTGNDTNNGLTQATAWANPTGLIAGTMARFRPRHTINIMKTDTAVAGNVLDLQTGTAPFKTIGPSKHQYARFIIQGYDASNRTIIDGTGDNYAIIANFSYMDIKNFEIASVAGGASVQFTGGTGNTISNCSVHNQTSAQAAVSFTSTASVTISGCQIYSNAGRGILAASTSATILRNLIYSNNNVGIQSYSPVAIAYNVLYGHVNQHILLSEGATTANIYNNTIYESGGAQGIRVDNKAIVANVKNNIVSCASGWVLVDAGETNTITDSNNLVYGTNKYSGTWAKTNNVELDPLFVTAGSDFHLQAASPAKDAGVELGYTSDYDGKPVPKGIAPDIGAYEFQGGNRMLLLNVELRGRERGMRR